MLLGKKATRIFTGTDGMEKFFPAKKIMITGNPVRTSISSTSVSREEAIRFFSLDDSMKTVLVVGGSLGAKSINEAIDKGLDELINNGLQLIWQTGKPYAARGKERATGRSQVWVNEFITDMDKAYAAADIVVARAGAMTVAELCVVKKPVLFVPYPFAAEDHQTVNARQLVDKKAALMIKDSDAQLEIIPALISLAKDETKQRQLKENISKLAITNADVMIADEVLKLINKS